MSSDKGVYSEDAICLILGKTYGIERGLDCAPNILMYGYPYTVEIQERTPYEADFLYITKSYYLYEIEVKVSISDFRADLKKKMYHNFPEVRAFSYCVPIELYQEYKDELLSVCKDKGAGLITVAGRSACTQIKPKQRKDVVPLIDERYIYYLKLFAKKWVRSKRYEN